MASPVLYHHASSLEHDTGGHPEQAARIPAIERELAAGDWLGYDVRDSPAVGIALVEAVHDAGYVRAMREFCEAGGGMLDVDTVASRGSWVAALHAAGGAVALVDALVAEGVRAGASLHRPPGHHAEPARAMGFCLLNNVAIAARHAIDAHGLERVLILDWDVHHGNGTNDIFHASPEVLFASIHEWPLYPGTGPASDVGSGPGEGFTVNLPVAGGSGDALFCSLVEHVVVVLARSWEPQLVLVSAGFDAHVEDPLATCTVTDGGYAAMAASVRRLADELGVGVGVVLEGGYALGALARSCAATLAAIGGEGPEVAADVPLHPAAAQAAARLAGRWPALA